MKKVLLALGSMVLMLGCGGTEAESEDLPPGVVEQRGIDCGAAGAPTSTNPVCDGSSRYAYCDFNGKVVTVSCPSGQSCSGGTCSGGTAPPPGTMTNSQPGPANGQCTITQTVGRSTDGTQMTATCTVTCAKTATIGMYNRMYYSATGTGGAAACTSPQKGAGNIKTQSVQCTAPYAAGTYSGLCFADVYVGGEGVASVPVTPQWVF
ncbi:hypothetical protein [Corallococcus carmarthensis]|uniref:hypothetical protein n=1 Tax=Corallococcus carmarthensis TaxID=2316728 RepID=UPI00148E1FE4|nr:hypothetical protein [Corallococcus carmarthensis]NOK22745.1 hypothetical protein [Corallococcus carmarthensis]